jgi:threonine dehydratase
VITTSMVTRDDVEAAAARTRGVVRHTPLTLVESGILPGTVMLKLEQLQHAQTFGVRAVFNQTLAALEQRAFDPGAGIACVHDHARHVGRILGLSVTIVADEDEAADHCASTGALHCAADDPQAMAGTATVGLELWIQTAGQLDTVVVPSSLYAAVSSALLGYARVVEAEPDALRDAAVARMLWDERRIAVDTGAAAAYAVLHGGHYRPAPQERVAVVLASAVSPILSI